MNKPFRLPWHKRIFKHSLFQDLSTWLIAQMIRLIGWSFRAKMEVHPDAAPYVSGKENAIFCFWHGRMIVFPLFNPKARAMHILISHHRDGELIAKVIRHFGVDSVRGSSSKGAKSATKMMLQLLEKGDNIGITPDGPRGPTQQAAIGAPHLAKMSQKPLIPITYGASNCKQLDSWDRFMIPLPFSRIMVQVGAPILVDKSTSKEAMEGMRQRVEETLNQLTNDVDSFIG